MWTSPAGTVATAERAQSVVGERKKGYSEARSVSFSSKGRLWRDAMPSEKNSSTVPVEIVHSGACAFLY